MAKYIGLIAGLFLAVSSAQADQTEVLAHFKEISRGDVYAGQTDDGQACQVFVLDLSTHRPLGYSITFPDWLYQVYFVVEGSEPVETMIFDADEDEWSLQDSQIKVKFSKRGEWSTTRYEFLLALDSSGQALQSVTLKKLGLLRNKRVVCNFR